MRSDNWFVLKLLLALLPFVLFVYRNSRANLKKEIRYKQYPMPLTALVYCVLLYVFMQKLNELCLSLFMKFADLFDRFSLPSVGAWLRNLYNTWGVYLQLVLFNTAALVVFILLKRLLQPLMKLGDIEEDSFLGSVIGLFYTYDEDDGNWYVRDHFENARRYLNTAYLATAILSFASLFISYYLSMKHLVNAPFYPVFAIIMIGELVFFIDGLARDERESELSMKADNGRHIASYPLLRKPLRDLFGDKLSAEGTTVNNSIIAAGAAEDILAGLEKEGGHLGRNYAAFIRKKADAGLRPNLDYVRSGYDLAAGRSLLFNTPFYDKLDPYVFYAMNRALLTGGKVLIVPGRHGTEEDLLRWVKEGMLGVSNVPELWTAEILTAEKREEDDLPDIGVITCSGVHDLDIHRNNLPFLRYVSFVVIVEPSRLVTTAQIGLNLLIKCCGKEKPVTFCSVDRNCDGLVDALSHILMTEITEVSATEYPHGTSSYMYWTADEEYLQHRLIPGVSRSLGMGTELSMVALKNQVKQTVWYGGDAFPVLDERWIAKQYYYDLLSFAQLPANQETFDNCFKVSFNMCDEKVSDYSFITVEDDRSNLFETRRNFATIAEKQGFVNVISPEYMLREYMADNTAIFTADAKAIPYITADYARTRRNAILSLCLLMCIGSVEEETLRRSMSMLNLDVNDPVGEIWREIGVIFGSEEDGKDRKGNRVLSVRTPGGGSATFEKDGTLLFKRAYSVEKGQFENVYAIENPDFAAVILDDLQNAAYVAEHEDEDVYIGTELKGHVYQKYMPGQFFTIRGKYYEMVGTTADNRIQLRRASEHIGTRLSYKQVRNYEFTGLADSDEMGALKTVNGIDVHYQFADFRVKTPGYWKLTAGNDFAGGSLVEVNGVPVREYHHKLVLKLDFSRLGEAFTDSVRKTLTNLLNETFVTLFADNQAFVSAVTLGETEAPLTYSLTAGEGVSIPEKCIFIIEDSQLDIGLLVAVERNLDRIFQIISDYLSWNAEKIEESIRREQEGPEEPQPEPEPFVVGVEEEPEKKKGFFGRVFDKIRNVFHKKKKDEASPEGEEVPEEEMTFWQRRKKRRQERKEKRRQKKLEKQRKKAGEEPAGEGENAPEAPAAPQPFPGPAETPAEPGAFPTTPWPDGQAVVYQPLDGSAGTEWNGFPPQEQPLPNPFEGTAEAPAETEPLTEQPQEGPEEAEQAPVAEEPRPEAPEEPAPAPEADTQPEEAGETGEAVESDAEVSEDE